MMKHNNNLKFLYVFAGCALVSLLAIAFLGFISWSTGDDLVIPYQVMDMGFLTYVKSQYMKWDGRFFSAIIYGLMFKNFYFEKIAGPLWIIMFFVTCYIVIVLADNDDANPNMRRTLVVETIVVIWITWFSGLEIITAETLYWYTGGVQYALIPFAGFGWFFLMRKILSGSLVFVWPVLTVPLFLAASLFVGGGNQTFSPSLFFLIILSIMTSGKKLKDQRIFIIAFAFFVAGMIVMFAAPGNFARAVSKTGIASRSALTFSIKALLVSYGTVLADFFKWAKYLIIITVTVRISLAFINARENNQENHSRDEKNKNESFIMRNKKIIYIYGFLAAAFINVAPFMLASGYAARRSSVFFRFFLLLFLWGIIDYYSQSIVAVLRAKLKIVKAISVVIVLGFGLSVASLSIIFLIQGYGIKKQLSERAELLTNMPKNTKNNLVKVEPVEGTVPVCYIQLFHGDIKTNPAHVFNVCTARRYNVKAIALSKPYKRYYRLFKNVIIKKD